jgi:hypothetical protein
MNPPDLKVVPIKQREETIDEYLDRRQLEDQVARLIDRLPERLLGRLLSVMDDDDLELLDIVAAGIMFAGVDREEGVRRARVIAAAKRRHHGKAGA